MCATYICVYWICISRNTFFVCRVKFLRDEEESLSNELWCYGWWWWVVCVSYHLYGQKAVVDEEEEEEKSATYMGALYKKEELRVEVVVHKRVRSTFLVNRTFLHFVLERRERKKRI